MWRTSINEEDGARRKVLPPRGFLMRGALTGWINRIRPRAYGRKPSLVLVNGLAEQPESWYRNHRYWRRYFDVFMPNVLVYDGEAIHARLKRKQPISVEYLVDQLHLYLTH